MKQIDEMRQEAMNVRDRIQKELDNFQKKHGFIIVLDQNINPDEQGNPYPTGSTMSILGIEIAAKGGEE